MGFRGYAAEYQFGMLPRYGSFMWAFGIGVLPFLKTRHGPRNVRLEAFKGFGSRFLFLKASSVRRAEI